MRFRARVFANRRRITPGCLTLLLRLSDDMDAKAIVSVPRTRLSADLDAPPSRISEWVREARNAGFLSQVRRGRPGTTAVYQGNYVGLVEVRHGVPSEGYATLDQAEVRPGVPSDDGAEVRPSVLPRGCSEDVTAEPEREPTSHDAEKRTEETPAKGALRSLRSQFADRSPGSGSSLPQGFAPREATR